MIRTIRLWILSALALALLIPAGAQAFAEVKTGLVDYSKADIEPRKPCEALGKFTGWRPAMPVTQWAVTKQ